MEEILKETKEVVEEICEKYGYDSEDKEGNDSLKTVLLKAIPAMLKDCSLEDRKLFYQMIRHTPIVITENLTQEEHDKLIEKYIGNVNQHIKEEEIDLGEYKKGVADGAYTSVPIIDENMRVIGKKSFIYVQKIPEFAYKRRKLFGTDISVNHLIHELGHAWEAEKEQYIMQEDGTLKERIGTAEYIYEFSRDEDGRYIQKLKRVSGLMIDEAMNTIFEEKSLANYLGISLEEVRKQFEANILIPSVYQGFMSNMTEYMLQKLPKEDFVSWGRYGDQESKSRIESAMVKTEYWKNREKEILPNSGSKRSYDIKRGVISKVDGIEVQEEVQEFFKKYEDIYFPDVSKMSPLEKIDNVLEQACFIDKIKQKMGLENYGPLLDCMRWEGYGLINQTVDVLAEERLKRAVGGVTLSEVNRVTNETRALAKDKVQVIENRKEGVNR